MNKVEMVNAAARLVVLKSMEKETKDYSGFVDWLHPLGVADRVRKYGEIAITVALLHDIVEDYDVTISDLAEIGFSPEVLTAIEHITRDEEGGESYKTYIERVGENLLATLVKIEDITYNLARVDYGIESTKADRLRRRWLAALTVLRDALVQYWV